ncbi:uncharacterized protein Dwil_GK22531 [Drosophila willistoni]|uniref:Uncharacterized protein n=1 Tax=Drosophila willistoni TaxID=7260 RepID=B4NFG4_DROWI|nr:uncharacterized protein CG4951 [Drosophila willistoni]EDW83031.2 uncharacterized protein Dwil_GK22531 [Drosophila willistoni]
MSLTAAGNYQVLLQAYKYKNVNITCSYKIYPNAYDFDHQKVVQDYHWMTASRWSRIENALRRHFEGIRNPNLSVDADKLQAEMQIDHIKVQINVASSKWISSIKEILQCKETPDKEPHVGLDIVLQYISHKDIISGASPPKRQRLEADTSKPGQSKQKPRTKHGETSKPTRVAGGTEVSSRSHQPYMKIKRERRSISQSDNREKTSTKSSSSSSNGHVSRKDKAEKSSNLRANSVESTKPTRRSARSPVQPQRFQNFILGQKTSARAVKPTEEVSLQPNKFEQLDGLAIDALQKFDNMLNTPIPLQVNILLLESKNNSDIMETFEKYKTDFDRLFKRREHKTHTDGYLGICHVDVMDILNKSIQSNMLKKLGDVYSKKSSHASLVFNGLLPMWIMRLFMDEYNFNSEEDVAVHIKKQLKYASYLKALNNDPLASDLDY